MFVSQFKDSSIARSEELWFVLSAAMPHRPHGMNDAPGPETVSLREFCIAGLAPPKQPAGLGQFRTGCTVNGAAHTAAGKEPNRFSR